MGPEKVSVDELEGRCLPVRKGDMELIEELSTPFLEKKKGFLASLMSDGGREPETVNLFAASEGLLSLGMTRESIKPLEVLIENGRIPHSVKDIALARAGQIAAVNELPMDMSPIVSELGLSRKDLDSALMGIRSARGKRDILTDMEKALLQSILLFNRYSWIESEKLRTLTLRGMREGLERAKELSRRLKGEGGKYHQCRCELEFSRIGFHLGDYFEALEGIEKGISICRNYDFSMLKKDLLVLKGTFCEDEEEARRSLREAQEISGEMKNARSMAEAGLILGHRQAREGESEGIDRILHSARTLQELEGPHAGALESAEAALWSIRTGDPERGASIARASYRKIRASRDRESVVRVLCILFFAYIRMDSRKKAKKLLLEIVTNHPVKQFPNQFSLLKEAVRDVKWLREDRDTSHLFEEEPVHTIPRNVVDEIIGRAKDAYPKEFGAMLRGIKHITHMEPIMEGAANRSSFMFSMFSRFSQREISGEGVVHSHPSGSANPSRADVSLFGRFPGINIIIAYPFEYDSMAAYDRMGNRVRLVIVDVDRERKE